MEPEIGNEELARAWIAEISINDGVVEPNRAFDVAFSVDELIERNPARAWAVITVISRNPMSSWAEANFAAGPLSSFVLRHGSQFSHEIRELAQANPVFESHLLGVVFQDEVERILHRS